VLGRDADPQSVGLRLVGGGLVLGGFLLRPLQVGEIRSGDLVELGLQSVALLLGSRSASALRLEGLLAVLAERLVGDLLVT
jgi:hypothetical protein